MINKLRSIKVKGIAAFDVLATVTLSYLLSSKMINMIGIFVLLIITAIVVHRLLSIPTMLNYYLGINTLNEVIDGRIKRGEIII